MKNKIIINTYSVNSYSRIKLKVDAMQIDLSKFKRKKGGNLEFINVFGKNIIVLFDHFNFPYLSIELNSLKIIIRNNDWIIKFENGILDSCSNERFINEYKLNKFNNIN
jgi:hypothetical protein